MKKHRILFIGLIVVGGCLSVLQMSCDKDDDNNTSPVASFTVNPTLGTLVTVFEFDASGSSDKEDPTSALEVRWDWENDGTWDEDYTTTKTATHQYSSSGDKKVKMEVKDVDGSTNSTTKSVTINESGTLTDIRDGKSYTWVKIGNQSWMAKNLDYESNGSSCFNCYLYGRLYEWSVTQSACPAGWHVPSDAEWKELEMTLGMTSSEADKPNWRGTDQGNQLKSGGTSGFKSLMGGFKTAPPSNQYAGQGIDAYYWTATGDGPTNAWNRQLNVNNSQVLRFSSDNLSGYSVRCVKD